MKLISSYDAKSIAKTHLTDPYHIVSTFAVIDKSPAIDPVHAAGGYYCRECRYWMPDLGFRLTAKGEKKRYGSCGVTHFQTNEAHFCGGGERKEEDDG